MDTEVSYAGITKRSLAAVIDRFIMTAVMCLITFLFMIQHYSANKEEAFDPNIYKLLCVSFTVISTLVLEALLITRFSGTPGQLLCGIHMKHANTFKNVTLMQAIIRCVSREVILTMISLLTRRISGWFAILIILILIFAIFDKRKQFLHDKIAKTVVIDYKSS